MRINVGTQCKVIQIGKKLALFYLIFKWQLKLSIFAHSHHI